ncbi:MAG TPA: hypothetical protein VN176_17425 [Verrucomicrobiae bacterium]|jgi:hypothetical protein|nr:hypothetical protein [Verrucomicrobiae bacterium]
MSAAPPMTTPPIEPIEPGLSEPARIINTFFAPSKTFEDLKRKSSWWVPFVLLSVFSLIYGFVVVQKVDLVQFSRHQIEQSKMAQRQMDQLSPEQQEQNLRLRASISKFTFFIIPVFLLIGGLIYALVLWAIFTFGFAAEIPFGRSLAIVFYAGLPAIITFSFICVSLLVSADPNSIDIGGNPVATNPAFFMNPETTSKFLYALIARLDVIGIWTTVLAGLGFSVNSVNRKVSTGAAMGVVFGLYALVTLITAGFKAAF